jgi:hypothetical protein
LHGDGTNGAQNNTFLDSSTNNFLITRNGNTTQGSFSPYGSNWSNHFASASSQYQTIGARSNWKFLNDGTSNYTVEFWVNLSDTASRHEVFSTNTNTIREAYGITCGTNSGNAGNVFVQISSGVDGDSFSAVTAGGKLTVGTWSHVAFTLDVSTKTLKIYVNGVLEATTTRGTWSFANINPSYTLQIGRFIGERAGVGGYMNGYISNLRMVNGSILYTSNFTPPTSTLTAVSGTALLTCQSNRFVDNSSNQYAVTAFNAISVERFNPFGTSTAYNTATIGGSGYFDGAGDYLTVAADSSNLGSGDFNISFWMYFTNSSVDTVPATNAYDGNVFTNGWYFFTSGTSAYFGLGSASATDFVSGSFGSTNAWHYIEATRSGSTLSLYIDGVLAQSKTNTKSGSVSGNTTKIGSQYGGGDRYFTGYITDFKVVVGTAGNTSNYTPPTTLASATGSNLLLSMQNGAIFDNAMMNDLETVGNAQISTSVVKYGTGSMSFTTTGDYLTTLATPNLSFGTGSFTVECWAYFNTVSGDMTIYTGTTSGDVNIRIVTNEIRIGQLGISWDTIGSALSWSTGTWYHIAIVRNGSTVTFYRDGISAGSGSNTIAYNVTGSAAIAQTGGGAHLDGYIDDLRITKGYARYTANFTPPTGAFSNIGPT